VGALGLSVVAAAQQVQGLTTEIYANRRQDMVDFQLRDRGIRQRSLLDAMGTVPRHLFVPMEVRQEAYRDLPIVVGNGGIPQPYVSARMIELLNLDGSERVLEIGTGSGYDAAILSQLACEVFTIEISEELGSAARIRLKQLGFENISVRVGDGNEGWASEAPFDAIILTAAPSDIPPKLIEQLKMDGLMVIAVGGRMQTLMVVRKTEQGLVTDRKEPVVISPMSPEP